jgi:WD40 repeat protein
MPEIVDHQFDTYVEYAGFIQGSPVFALSDGIVQIGGAEKQTFNPHDGLLSACLSLDHTELITGGEDGLVMATNQHGEMRIIADQPNKWIDQVASGPHCIIGFASGRTAFVIESNGAQKEFIHARSIEGLCFAPKGKRLAMARYNGVSLYWSGMDAEPVELEWAGAHTAVTFSPNGKFIVTTMQENALHGWRLDQPATGDGKHMRMTGYPAKVKSTSWSPKGKWLATSGAEAAILWPFSGKEGPMGKSPKELGTRSNTMVTCVACHPSKDVVAVGYGDGMILAIRIDDASEAVLRREGTAPISTLNWDKKGQRVAFGSEEGEAGVINISS